MKVAVYAISLNEEKFVKRWAESAKDADYIILADTGSTDKTVELAKKLGVTTHQIVVSPWRFDDARNASLALVPEDADYCIALDLDEVLVKGWRAELEKAYKDGSTRPRYQYIWSWKENGKPNLQFGGDKIHSRRGYRWVHPVHEVLRPYGNINEVQGWYDLYLEHHPDQTKPRSQYFPLLKMAVQENPNDDRNAFYYARELYFYGLYEEAIEQFNRHLSLPSATWKPERAASYRFMAKCSPKDAQKYLTLAVEEDPSRREASVELAKVYYEQGNWEKCYELSKAALEIKSKPLDYLCEDFAWGALPHDLLAISAYNLGKYAEALAHGKLAVKLDDSDPRLKTNLEFYANAFSS